MVKGIRAKLIALLVLVGLLPLTAALVIIVVGGRRLQTQTIGQSFQSVAVSEGRAVQRHLIKDIEKFHLMLNQGLIVSDLARRDRKMSPEELKALDDAWGTLPFDAEPMSSVLKNPIAGLLLLIQGDDPCFAEILVTDRFGQLVAATGRTTDYYQSDEDWWKAVKNEPGGGIVVPAVNYDASTQVWSINLCIPIVGNGELVGVAKAVSDVSGWIGGAERVVGYPGAKTMLVREDGTIIYCADVEPLKTKARHWTAAIATAETSGWRVTEDGEIQAYAPIVLPGRIRGHNVRIPSWRLVVYMHESDALGAVYSLSLILLVVGSGMIGAIFLGGLLMVERSVIRRLRKLGQATKKVAGGDLSYRVQSPQRAKRLLGSDEIDELGRDFNEMVSQLERTHEELRQSNELKMKFIRIASHELRTPVSYMLAMVHVMKDSKDLRRITHALKAIGAKAERLEQTIRSMFKLLPEQRFARALRYGEVNLSALLEEVYLECFPFVEKRRQRLIMDSGEVLVIQADREKLRDVLENLVMNAVKFTPDGGTITVRGSPLSGDRVSIVVEDQGPGVPSEELPHIFEPFYSGGDVLKHSSGTGEYQKRGMGLGLAIVRHFVELHGGTVSVSLGRTGSVFTVILPVSPPS